MKLKGTNNYGFIFSFNSDGNAKIFLKDSLSLENIELVGLNSNRHFIELDTLHYNYEITSAGFNDGKFAQIKINDKNYVPVNIRGHHILLINRENFSIEQQLLFDVLGKEEEVNRYINFIDTLSNKYLVLIAISDEGSQLGPELKDKIKTLGTNTSIILAGEVLGHLLGKREPQLVPCLNLIQKLVMEFVTIDTSISFLTPKGSILTSEIGPVGRWGKILVDQYVPSKSNITYFPIGIKPNGQSDTLDELTVKDSLSDISFIDAKEYPILKILAEFEAGDNNTSPELYSLGVDYDGIPELAHTTK